MQANANEQEKGQDDDRFLADEFLRLQGRSDQLKEGIEAVTKISKLLIYALIGAVAISWLAGRTPSQRIEITINDDRTYTTTHETRNDTRCFLWGCNTTNRSQSN